MKFFHDSDKVNLVRWYWCKQRANLMPFPTTFASGNWQSSKLNPWEGVGEIKGYPRVYDKGRNLTNKPAISPDGTEQQFWYGLSIKDENTIQIPECGVKTGRIKFGPNPGSVYQAVVRMDFPLHASWDYLHYAHVRPGQKVSSVYRPYMTGSVCWCYAPGDPSFQVGRVRLEINVHPLNKKRGEVLISISAFGSGRATGTARMGLIPSADVTIGFEGLLGMGQVPFSGTGPGFQGEADWSLSASGVFPSSAVGTACFCVQVVGTPVTTFIGQVCQCQDLESFEGDRFGMVCLCITTQQIPLFVWFGQIQMDLQPSWKEFPSRVLGRFVVPETGCRPDGFPVGLFPLEPEGSLPRWRATDRDIVLEKGTVQFFSLDMPSCGINTARGVYEGPGPWQVVFRGVQAVGCCTAESRLDVFFVENRGQ